MKDSLSSQQSAAARIRWRISAGLLFIGATQWAVLIICGFLRAAGLLPASAGPEGYYFAAGLPGMYLMMLAVLPSDQRVIRWLGLLLAIYTLGGGLIVVGLIAQAAAGSDGIDSAADRDCDPERTFGCYSFIVHWSGVATTAFIASAAFMRTGRKRADGSYVLTPRGALKRQWLVMRVTYFFFGVFTFVYLAMRTVSEEGYRFTSDFYGSVAHAACDVSLAVLVTNKNQRRAASLLRRIAATGDENEAAAISAMVSGIGLEKAMEMAEQTFRAIPLDSLKEEDLAAAASLVDSDLASRTVKAALGEVDAFVSHSWRDSGQLKWQVLSSWADEFKAQHGRSPLIWLDKVS